MKYITSDSKKTEGCVFCTKLNDDLAFVQENYVIYRGQATFVIMNIYPYNTGHLMILPHEHVATLSAISAETRLEIMNFAAYFTDLLTELMHPDGFNVGLNLGQGAGAGIDGHVHLHIVPRWNGDSNFMAAIAETRILPETLEDTYERIVNLLKKQPPEF
jgi:ATP adenylyltransferase